MMSTPLTIVSIILTTSGCVAFLVGMVVYGRRTDDRNYGRAEAEVHVQSACDFLPVTVLHTVPAVIEYEAAVDAGMRAGAGAR